MDFTSGLVNSVLNLPNGQVKFFEEFKLPGLLIFRGKKSKISRDLQRQIRGKIGRFRGIFRGKKVKIRRKFSKDFQRQIFRKIAQFQGKFRGKTSPRNNQ